MIGYCSDCKDPHLSLEIASFQKHKGNHLIYNKADVLKFVQTYLMQTSSKVCDRKEKIVKDFFQTFQSKLAQMNNKILNSIEKIGVQTAFMSNQENVNNSNIKRAENVGTLAFQVLKSKKELSCGNVSEIIDEIDKMSRIIQNGGKLRYELLTDSFEKIIEEVKSVLSSLSSKYLKELDEVDTNLWRENKNISSVRLIEAEQHKTAKTKNIEKVERVERGFDGKIVEIKNALNCFEEKEQFSIKVRIDKILKQFESKGRTKILFLGRDKSGLFKLAFRPHQYLVEGNQVIIESSKVTPIKGERCVVSIFDSKIHLVSERHKQTNRNKQLHTKLFSNFDVDQPKNQMYKDKQIQNRTGQQKKSEFAHTIKNQRPIKDEKILQNRRHQLTSNLDKDPLLVKIKDIEPGSENLNLCVKVYQIRDQTNQKLKCTLGDQTGIVQAEVSIDCSFVMEGSTILIYNMNAEVIKEHILLTFNSKTKIIRSNKIFPIIALQNNISAAEWEEDD